MLMSGAVLVRSEGLAVSRRQVQRKALLAAQHNDKKLAVSRFVFLIGRRPFIFLLSDILKG